MSARQRWQIDVSEASGVRGTYDISSNLTHDKVHESPKRAQLLGPTSACSDLVGSNPGRATISNCCSKQSLNMARRHSNPSLITAKLVRVAVDRVRNQRRGSFFGPMILVHDRPSTYFDLLHHASMRASSTAHNGLVAGSSPAEPTNEINPGASAYMNCADVTR
jgi:hypothetical protein